MFFFDRPPSSRIDPLAISSYYSTTNISICYLGVELIFKSLIVEKGFIFHKILSSKHKFQLFCCFRRTLPWHLWIYKIYYHGKILIWLSFFDMSARIRCPCGILLKQCDSCKVWWRFCTTFFLWFLTDYTTQSTISTHLRRCYVYFNSFRCFLYFLLIRNFPPLLFYIH
jgi:hypothetical protein